MSLVTLGEARALVSTALGDPDLQAVIDREEAWLARRVGALSGARTQRFWIRDVDRDDPLELRRPTAAITVSDNGVTVLATKLRLLGDGTLVERSDGPWAGPFVDVTYTPNDMDEVKRVVVDLARLIVIDAIGSFDSERIGDYSYSRGTSGTSTSGTSTAATAKTREGLARSLLPHTWRPRTVRLRGSGPGLRIGDVTSP